MKFITKVCLFTSFVLQVMRSEAYAQQSNITSFISGQHAEISKTYSIRVNGREVFVEKFKDISFAWFSIEKQCKLEINLSGNVGNVTVSPLSAKIHYEQKGNELSLTLNEPHNLVIQREGSGERLFLFAEAVEKKVPVPNGKTVISVAQFGVEGAGNKLETNQLQKALDAVSNSGKILYFPSGIYRTGTLRIRSNTKIYLSAGTIIKGSDNRADYPVDEGSHESDIVNDKATYSDNGERMTYSRLILIDKAENVSITGRGIIDGSGSILRPQENPANLIRIRQSRNALIEGIMLRDPASWNTHILYSENVVIRNVKILNDRDVPNTDGIDPDASKHVLIDHCFAYCSDDNIAIKSSNNGGLLGDVDDITVKDCIFLTKKSSLKIGTETKASIMKNILFENNDVIESDRGMALYCSDGAVLDSIRFVNNRFERNFPDSQKKGIHFVIKNRSGAGEIRNVLVKDCTFLESFPKPSELTGLDKDHTITNVLFDHLIIAGKICTTLEEAGIKTNEFTNRIELKN